MKKAVSLIALTITIVVAIIISGTVVVMLTDMSSITKARKVSFQDKLSKYNEQLSLYKTSNVNEKIPDSKNENLEKYIPSITNVSSSYRKWKTSIYGKKRKWLYNDCFNVRKR